MSMANQTMATCPHRFCRSIFTKILAVDAHSKWPEVVEIPSTFTGKTISALRHMFATPGLPCQVVSDNGPRFRSAEFADFIRRNSIKHILCSPYHPSLNGLVERFVKMFKNAMKAGKNTGCPPQHHPDSFLLTYR